MVSNIDSAVRTLRMISQNVPSGQSAEADVELRAAIALLAWESGPKNALKKKDETPKKLSQEEWCEFYQNQEGKS